MTSDYLDRPCRPLAEALAGRIAKGDRVRHPLHGEAVAVDVLHPHGVARIAFPSGGGIWVAIAELEKLPPPEGGDAGGVR